LRRVRLAFGRKEIPMLDKPANGAFGRAGAAPAKDPEALTVDEVRQGETGHGVRYMLMFSLAAALIALAIAWVFVV